MAVPPMRAYFPDYLYAELIAYNRLVGLVKLCQREV